ncbi:hypothetical protein [Prosthecobacter sp.]|uniref:hypothetical protein n=1 Tax=Prosthecobacter sp. TaxID=1965333 RepID=UPI003783A9FC
MFTQVSLRSARHESGDTIFVADQERAAYEDEYVKTTLQADFLRGVVPLYRRTLKITVKGRRAISRIIQPREMIDRIRQGFSFLGIPTEEIAPYPPPSPIPHSSF